MPLDRTDRGGGEFWERGRGFWVLEVGFWERKVRFWPVRPWKGKLFHVEQFEIGRNDGGFERFFDGEKYGGDGRFLRCCGR